MRKKLIVFLLLAILGTESYSQMYVGSVYYPERLSAARISQDARIMKELNFNFARIGDLLWSCFEPFEGDYRFDWLDRAIETLREQGVKTMLCTPTAAIPKWLYDAHPEVMIVSAEGVRKPYGRRRHACINNPIYRDYCFRIATAIARHYKDNDAVVAIQVDNELATEEPYCYCEECLNKFKQWLSGKYGTIDHLNRAWGTTFWSQTLHDFDQVWLPRRMDNPTAYLDYQRFYSDCVIDFFNMQKKAIKDIIPEMPITTNIGGSGYVATFDLYKMSDACDVLSFDNYPINVTLETLYGNDVGQPFDPSMVSFAIQIIRGGKQRPVWVTEAQVGRTALTQKEIVKAGYVRLWNHQQLAYGVTLSSFFPFRSFESGHEHLMAGVIESDNVKRDKFYEIQKTAKELSEIYRTMGRVTPVAQAAIIRDFDVDWVFSNGYTFCPDLKYLREVYSYYSALRSANVMTDVVSPEADLSKYQIIVVPYLVNMSADFCDRLEQAVQNGATLLLTCLNGVRDSALHKNSSFALPSLQTLAGIEIEGQEALFARKHNTMTYDGVKSNCHFWFDKIRLTTARSLASFDGNYFNGHCAVSVNHCGLGKVYYVATVPEKDLVGHLVADVVKTSGVLIPAKSASNLVDISTVVSEKGDRYLYVVNYDDAEQTIRLSQPVVNLLTGREQHHRVKIGAMEYLVLQIL